MAKYRRELLAHTSGNTLEIGFGTGLNLSCCAAHVRKLTTVDPNIGMHRRALNGIKRTGFEVGQRVLRGERLPFEDGAFDCVGCHLDRDIRAIVTAPPFASVKIDEFYLEKNQDARLFVPWDRGKMTFS